MQQQQQPFYGPLSLTTRVSRYTRRNTHPPTILIIIQSLSASSIYHSDDVYLMEGGSWRLTLIRLSFTEILGNRKLRSLGYVWRCLRDPTFSCFSRTPTCDRQTHTTTAYTALVWRRALKKSLIVLHNNICLALNVLIKFSSLWKASY